MGDNWNFTKICSKCDGTGYIGKKICTKCSGEGAITTDKPVVENLSEEEIDKLYNFYEDEDEIY